MTKLLADASFPSSTHFENCSPEPHLELFDRSFNSIEFLLPDLNMDIGNRKDIGDHSVSYKIVYDNSHHFYKFLPDLYLPTCVIRSSMILNSMTFNASHSSKRSA